MLSELVSAVADQWTTTASERILAYADGSPSPRVLCATSHDQATEQLHADFHAAATLTLSTVQLPAVDRNRDLFKQVELRARDDIAARSNALFDRHLERHAQLPSDFADPQTACDLTSVASFFWAMVAGGPIIVGIVSALAKSDQILSNMGLTGLICAVVAAVLAGAAEAERRRYKRAAIAQTCRTLTQSLPGLAQQARQMQDWCSPTRFVDEVMPLTQPAPGEAMFTKHFGNDTR